MELRTLMITMEMIVLAVFASYMFGYIYANAEGIDYYLDYYKADLAIMTNTMLSSENDMSITYPLKEGYFLGIENSKICVWYEKSAIGLKSKIADFYRGLKGKLNKKCESFAGNNLYSLAVAKIKPGDSKETNYIITKTRT